MKAVTFSAIADILLSDSISWLFSINDILTDTYRLYLITLNKYEKWAIKFACSFLGLTSLITAFKFFFIYDAFDNLTSLTIKNKSLEDFYIPVAIHITYDQEQGFGAFYITCAIHIAYNQRQDFEGFYITHAIHGRR